MKEKLELLGVKTDGIIATYTDKDHNRSEPTCWRVLDKIVQSGHITKDSVVVDYGSGKGRAAFYFNCALGCSVTGVEYAEPIYQIAEKNLDRYGRDKGVRFICAPAESYEPVGADTFYFFNPFSYKTVERCLDNILAQPTAKKIIFYYIPWRIEFLLRSYPQLKLIYKEDCRVDLETLSCNKLMVFEILKK